MKRWYAHLNVRSDRLRLRGAAVGVALATAIALAACGSSSSSSSSASTGGASSSSSASSTPASSAGAATNSAGSGIVAEAKAAVLKGYGTGYVEPPPTTPTKPATGKTVWWISCGQQYASCAEQAANFQGAAKLLGWHTNVVDGKAVASVASSEIRQAIAAKANAVIVDSYDCPDIKTALRAATAAHVMTYNYRGLDCNDPFYHAGPPLYTASLKARSNVAGPDQYGLQWGKLMADYAIAKSNGHLSLLAFHETSYGSQYWAWQGFKTEIAKCSGCKVISVPYTFAELPDVAPAKWRAAIQQNPSADAAWTSVDSLMSLGLESALRSAGHPFKWVFGAEGTSANFTLIHQGFQTDSVVRQDLSGAWSAADAVNRLLDGTPPASLPNEGGGYQITDAQHNLPPAGQEATAALPYKILFKKIWVG